MKAKLISEQLRSAGFLRQELAACNLTYALERQLPHEMSYGEVPSVVYRQSECGRYHGNFIAASYKAIRERPEWSRRLDKVHSQGKASFPKCDTVLRELDSAMSSDALLMNIFCYPGVTTRRELCGLLGIEEGGTPAFGFLPRVPLHTTAIERTEVDMRLGHVLFEAKLTEGDFQIQDARIVEQYRDLKEVFECRRLPRQSGRYVGYQLLRNVLAAYALNLNFCLLVDARRPDLLEQWYRVMRCIRSLSFSATCKVLTWQELAVYLPAALREFLQLKYGIVAQARAFVP